jgi:septum site-determining protein MinC
MVILFYHSYISLLICGGHFLMDESSVAFKGTVNGLTIVLKEEEEFDSLLQLIDKKIAAAGKFFKGASLDVKYRGRQLSKEQEKRVLELMAAKSGAKIKSFTEEPSEPIKPQADPKAEPGNRVELKRFFFKGIKEGSTKFYRGTVRSGQLISFDGNLVVIGDINPGGEVVATGNVIVMGALRGIVHAGADGNREAIVVANNLQPPQLRIADVITRSPDGGEISRSNAVPELAFVKGEMVYIERFLPQYK